MEIISLLETLVPWGISLASIIVAGVSIRTNKKIAKNQAIFAQKAKIYDDFLQAFSALAYDHNNQQKRDNLTNATYRACMYARKILQRELNCFVNMDFSARTRDDFVKVETFLQDILDGFCADLQGRRIKKNSPLYKLTKAAEASKADHSGV